MTSGLKALIRLTSSVTILICLIGSLSRGLSNTCRSTESLNKCEYGSASSLGRKHNSFVSAPWAIPLASRTQYSPKSKATNAIFILFFPLLSDSQHRLQYKSRKQLRGARHLSSQSGFEPEGEFKLQNQGTSQRTAG